jgi:hypothetical protein
VLCATLLAPVASNRQKARQGDERRRRFRHIFVSLNAAAPIASLHSVPNAPSILSTHDAAGLVWEAHLEQVGNGHVQARAARRQRDVALRQALVRHRHKPRRRQCPRLRPLRRGERHGRRGSEVVVVVASALPLRREEAEQRHVRAHLPRVGVLVQLVAPHGHPYRALLLLR